MNDNLLPGGLWPVMLTPFTRKKTIDFDALHELTDFYFRKGAAGLFAYCLSSEMYHLTDDEKYNLVAEVIRASDGRMPVIATGTKKDLDISGQIDQIKEMYDMGVTAVVIITNHLAAVTENDDILKKRFEQLIKNTPNIPLGLYECPDPYKRILPPLLTGWLARSGRFIYHKDTTCDIEAIRKKLHAIRDTSLGLYNANTPSALESLKAGARGLSPISANFYPELYDSLCWISGDSSQSVEARKLQNRLTLMDAVTRIKYPLSAKLFLSRRGLKILPETRVDIPVLNDEEERMIAALFEQFQEILPQYDL